METVDKIILYGCGRRCQRLYSLLQKGDIKVQYIIDSNPEKWGDDFGNLKIVSPDVLQQKVSTPLCITIANEEAACEIRTMLKEKYHYDMEYEISYKEVEKMAYRQFGSIKEIWKDAPISSSRGRCILFDCSTIGLGLGGIEEWTKSLVNEMVKRGWKDIYIVSGPGNYEVSEILKPHVKYMDINRSAFIDENTFYNILEFLSQHRPCTVVANQPDALLFTAGIIKQYFPDAIQVLAVIHNGSEQVYDNYLQFDDCIDTYVGVSEDIRKALINKGIDSGRVLHMTCPVECSEKLRRGYTGTVSKPIKIGYAGRLEVRQKRIDLLIKLLEELEGRNINYELEIAGKGTAEAELAAFITGSGIESKVKLLGRVSREKISDFWRTQDICINIADYEGRSISIMEAMANGAVPVVTATSGVREDITDGWNGYIVELEDYGTMAEHIERLANQRELLPEMGNRAHEVIYSKVQMSEHIKFWESVLD